MNSRRNKSSEKEGPEAAGGAPLESTTGVCFSSSFPARVRARGPATGVGTTEAIVKEGEQTYERTIC